MKRMKNLCGFTSRTWLKLCSATATGKVVKIVILNSSKMPLRDDARISVAPGKVDSAIRQLKLYPTELNNHNQKKLDDLKRYCTIESLANPVWNFPSPVQMWLLASESSLYRSGTYQREWTVIIQSSFIAEAPPPGSDPEKPTPPIPPRK